MKLERLPQMAVLKTRVTQIQNGPYMSGPDRRLDHTLRSKSKNRKKNFDFWRKLTNFERAVEHLQWNWNSVSGCNLFEFDWARCLCQHRINFGKIRNWKGCCNSFFGQLLSCRRVTTWHFLLSPVSKLKYLTRPVCRDWFLISPTRSYFIYLWHSLKRLGKKK